MTAVSVIGLVRNRGVSCMRVGVNQIRRLDKILCEPTAHVDHPVLQDLVQEPG